MNTELDWAELLRDGFFGAEFPGEPVTFCVDREQLSSISGLDAVRQFIRSQNVPRMMSSVRIRIASELSRRQ